MASEKPGSIEHDDSGFVALEDSLLSMENIDRASPDIWPEKIPGMSDFMHSFSPPNSTKPPYSKTFTPEDQNYLLQLASLPLGNLIAKVKELHDVAYQLGVEEAKEMTRGKYLNLFNRKKRNI
ncbi:protein lin-52 homolog isoform X2 [Agrilus planipennis]|uniref:Protein lin-52 homolog isoform X2 n=1 Tax=Agrilus planipennis TaxID=224129 RepID=A0A7F5RGH3_AGRPL|nr:protein lin-52 homolog isoform X2 [Agrilus planipennis]